MKCSVNETKETELDILYADNHIVVANKPPGLVTESLEGDSLERQVGKWIKHRYGKPGAVFVKAVHRLDKSARGIVILAKTSKALVRLHESFRSGEVRKRYLAWIQGSLEEKAGVFHDRIVRGEYKAYIVDDRDVNGKESILQYEILQEREGISLVGVELFTGRYHQIRAQFASRGHPVVNDAKYGACIVPYFEGIALQHVRVEFLHPVSKQNLRFSLEEEKNSLARAFSVSVS